jgi:hypothetical protein
MMEVEKIDALEDIGGQRVEGVDRPEPSAVNPMPGVLGGDSSRSEDAGDAGHEGAHPSNDTEARDGSRCHPAGASILEVSKDEDESQPPSMFRSVAFRPQAQDPAGDAEAEASAYHLHLSKLPLLLGDFVFSFSRFLFPYEFCFLEDLTNALAGREELVGGVSIGKVGLELPPHSPVVGPTPRSTTPRLECGLGMCLQFLVVLYCSVFAHANAPFFSFCFLVLAAFDTTITGWADAVHAVYNEIGGYFPCLSFVIFD